MKRRSSGVRNRKIIIWVLSAIVALSMACSFLSYLEPRRPATVPTSTSNLVPTATLTVTPTP